LGKTFICNGPVASTNIVTLPRTVVCVWHLMLQFIKLAPSSTDRTAVICKPTHSEKFVYARCLARCHIVRYIIKVLILWSWPNLFLRLCINIIQNYVRDM